MTTPKARKLTIRVDLAFWADLEAVRAREEQRYPGRRVSRESIAREEVYRGVREKLRRYRLPRAQPSE